MLYGDHGPYFECKKGQIYWKCFANRIKRSKNAYYDLAYSEGRGVKAYIQKKTVVDRPNPPGGSNSSMNNREGGYAEYQPGMVYITTSDIAPCEFVAHDINVTASQEKVEQTSTEAPAATSTIAE